METTKSDHYQFVSEHDLCFREASRLRELLVRLRAELEAERKVHHTLFQYGASRTEPCPAAEQALSEGAP